jgi:hypothetical protein
MPKIESLHHAIGREVDHVNRAPIHSGLADAGAAINRNEGPRAVGGYGNFMPGDASLGDGCNLVACIGINHAKRSVGLIRHEQQARRSRR